jgi:hypothetical protein
VRVPDGAVTDAAFRLSALPTNLTCFIGYEVT